MQRTLTARLGRLLRRLSPGLCAGVALVGVGCSSSRTLSDYPELPAFAQAVPVRTMTADSQAAVPYRPITPVSHEVALPAPTPVVQAGEATPIDITLDAVFRLAEQHNPRIALARERLNENQAGEVSSLAAWLPNTYAGIAYYRHEGAGQQPDGRFLTASYGSLYPGLHIQSELDLRERTFQQIENQRKSKQADVELAQVNNEVLTEAALTYVDLLTARRAEALAGVIESYELKLLDRAERLAVTETGAKVLVEGMKATVANRRQFIAKVRQQGNSASAKLVYLLGLPPGTCLRPIDPVLAPIDLADANAPACVLVEHSLAYGPGIRELQGILAVVQDAVEKAYGSTNLLPIVQAHAYEGLFGAGVGGGLTFGNRLDLGLVVRWNLTQLARNDSDRRTARSKRSQAMLSYQELRNKLAAGVQDAREGILSGKSQIGLATGGIRAADENYRLAEARLNEGVKDASPQDVLLGIRAMEQANFNYLTAVSEHNKAQIRLMMLLGPTSRPKTEVESTLPPLPSGKPNRLPRTLPSPTPVPTHTPVIYITRSGTSAVERVVPTAGVSAPAR